MVRFYCLGADPHIVYDPSMEPSWLVLVVISPKSMQIFSLYLYLIFFKVTIIMIHIIITR